MLVNAYPERVSRTFGAVTFGIYDNDNAFESEHL